MPLTRSMVKLNKEWGDVQCPICMETPHNAVLLICSSHDKGCRPYICNGNARRQFSCLTQYRATTSECKKLSCPLCRGHIIREQDVEKVPREFMNSKVRNCNVEGCEFTGGYMSLGKHWFNEHRRNGKFLREIEKKKKREWEQLQSLWELRDMQLHMFPLSVVPISVMPPDFRGQYEAVDETIIIPPPPGMITRGPRMSPRGHLRH